MNELTFDAYLAPLLNNDVSAYLNRVIYARIIGNEIIQILMSKNGIYTDARKLNSDAILKHMLILNNY